MSAPAAHESCPLTATIRPLTDVAPGDKLELANLKSLTAQALELYRSGETWPSSKTFQLEHESKVIATKGSSAQKTGRLSKVAWHARRSQHSPLQSHKLGYQDFYEGLAVDHPIKERQYVHDIVKYEKVGASVQVPSLEGDPCGKYISEVRADVWTSEYKLPILVGDRDFVELFLTVEFKPHADPLSSNHVDELLASLKEGTSSQDSAATAPPSDTTNLRRSCLNIQLPVSTSACSEKSNFVRASYGSVEVLKELDQDGTEWWMTVQSDSAGRIPLIFQELAMPSKVAPDVPLFIGWAIKQKTGV